MNAVNPVQTSMTAGDHSPAAEPSMEDILASIRRIIADDDSLPGRPHVIDPDPRLAPGSLAQVDYGTRVSHPAIEHMHLLRTPSPEVAMPSEDAEANISGLSASDGQEPVAAEPAPSSRVTQHEEAWGPMPEGNPDRQAPEPSAAGIGDGIFSPAVDSSVTGAFNKLAASRLVANGDELKGIAREMLRPMLKAWVDENLPGLVERLVSAEIERIARGGL